MGIQTGDIVHQIYSASDDCYIHCSACLTGGSNSGYDARPVSMLRTRCDLESLCSRSTLPRLPWARFQGYFEGKNYLGEFAAPALLLAFFEIFYPGLPASVGYRRRHHRGFTLVLEPMQNSAWTCIVLPIAGWTYVDCEEKNSAFLRR